MISGHGNIETAVNSIKKGAYDFIEKPFDSDLLIFKIRKAIENYILKKKIEKFSRKDLDSEIVAISKSSKLLEKKLKKLAKLILILFLLVMKEVVKNLLLQKFMTILIDQKKTLKQ